MNVNKIMELALRRSEILAELSSIDAQLREAAGETNGAKPAPALATAEVRRPRLLPNGTADRVIEWANSQQTPFSAEHVRKGLGFAMEQEQPLARMLGRLATAGDIERVVQGDRGTRSIYMRKPHVKAVAS